MCMTPAGEGNPTHRLLPKAIPLAHSTSSEDAAQSATEAQLIPPSSTVGASDESTFSVDYDGVPTPPSPHSCDEDGFERQVPLSITQEYAWKQQQLPLNPTTFNSTIGIHMHGPLNLNRLGWAFNQALQRHDAFRTCFIADPDGSAQPTQAIMRSPRACFEVVKVVDKAATEQGFKDLEDYKYDLAKGDTLKIVVFQWSPTDHLLIIAYHRLLGDGWTTEHLFVEAGQLYSGVQLEAAPSYADFAIRQRKQLESGGFSEDLHYWGCLFETLPARLPALDIPQAKASATPTSWTEHELSARLSRMVAVRIKDRSRKHKVTPMHYYLASYLVLLARLTSSTDVVIGVADTNRPTLTDQATMGFFANFLPVRLNYNSDKIFNEVLLAVKEQMRTALLHSAVPYGAMLERLGLPAPSADDPHSHAPLFQAVFDYKQGQAESGNIGEAKIIDSRTPRAGSPYDVTLEMSDDPSKDPLITVKLQKERYGPKDAEVVMDAYLSILSIFSRNPALRVEDGRLGQGAKSRA